MDRQALAEFLRGRRERLRPQEVGLDRRGPRARRTPGLRREEVAERAGVSVAYYERLEQGRATHPSAQVIEALAVALRLAGPDREHLATLAGYAATNVREPVAEVPAGITLLLDRIGSVAGVVCDPRQTLLAWNKLAAALFTDLEAVPPAQRTVDGIANRPGGTACTAPPSAKSPMDEAPGTDERSDPDGLDQGEPDGFAAQTAAHLRTVLARHPQDVELRQAVDRLIARDQAFASRWRQHQVRTPNPVRKRLVHPVVGELLVDCQSLDIPDTELRLLLYSAEPGTESQDRLRSLAADRPAS